MCFPPRRNTSTYTRYKQKDGGRQKRPGKDAKVVCDDDASLLRSVVQKVVYPILGDREADPRKAKICECVSYKKRGVRDAKVHAQREEEVDGDEGKVERVLGELREGGPGAIVEEDGPVDHVQEKGAGGKDLEEGGGARRGDGHARGAGAAVDDEDGRAEARGGEGEGEPEVAPGAVEVHGVRVVDEVRDEGDAQEGGEGQAPHADDEGGDGIRCCNLLKCVAAEHRAERAPEGGAAVCGRARGLAGRWRGVGGVVAGL